MLSLFKQELAKNAQFLRQFRQSQVQNAKKKCQKINKMKNLKDLDRPFRTSSPRPLFWQSSGKSVFSILHTLSRSLEQFVLRGNKDRYYGGDR